MIYVQARLTLHGKMMCVHRVHSTYVVRAGVGGPINFALSFPMRNADIARVKLGAGGHGKKSCLIVL